MGQAFSQDQQLVPVRTGLDQADAQLLRSLLEGNGISVFVNHENMGALNYGVRADILVHAGDKTAAEAVLSKIAMMPRCALPTRLDADGEELACQHCGSTRVHPFDGRVPSLIPGLKRRARAKEYWFHCLQCGSYYQDVRRRFVGLPIAILWGAVLGLSTLGLIWLINILRYSL